MAKKSKEGAPTAAPAKKPPVKPPTAPPIGRYEDTLTGYVVIDPITKERKWMAKPPETWGPIGAALGKGAKPKPKPPKKTPVEEARDRYQPGTQTEAKELGEAQAERNQRKKRGK